jgi:hypothetical protein
MNNTTSRKQEVTFDSTFLISKSTTGPLFLLIANLYSFCSVTKYDKDHIVSALIRIQIFHLFAKFPFSKWYDFFYHT